MKMREHKREGESERIKKSEKRKKEGDPPFMHHGTAARDNDFFVNYQVAYEAEFFGGGWVEGKRNTRGFFGVV